MKPSCWQRENIINLTYQSTNVSIKSKVFLQIKFWDTSYAAHTFIFILRKRDRNDVSWCWNFYIKFVYRLLKFKNNEYRFYFKIYCGFNVSYMVTSLFAVKNNILLTKFFFYFCILFKFFCLNICAKIYCKISLPYRNSQLLKMKHGNIMFSYFKFWKIHK